MSKRFGLVLAALLVVSALLAACSSESRDTAEDYMKALLRGDQAKAQELACESFKDQTAALGEAYAAQGVLKDKIDLKFDVGKGQNREEIIVTGAYKYGDTNDPMEFELTEKNNSRVVLWMKKSGSKWCVSEESEFGVMQPEAAAQ
jgi:hypothetical protein